MHLSAFHLMIAFINKAESGAETEQQRQKFFFNLIKIIMKYY